MHIRKLLGMLASGTCYLSLTATAALAADKPVMTWMLIDLPPASMPVNGLPTTGVSDSPLLLLAEQWPEVEHRYVVVSPARAMATLVAGEQACFGTALYTPERERVAYFSLTHVAPPLQLVVRTDVIQKLPVDDSGRVLPAALFDRSDLRGIVQTKRSYSPVLDALLNLRDPKSGIGNATSTDGGFNILQMLMRDRADYTLEHDFVFGYQMKRYPQAFADKTLKSLPVAGTEPIHVGIACPHTEWGREAILKIDGLLSGIAGNPGYQDSMSRWLTADVQMRYKSLQTQFFKQRAKPTDPVRYTRWVWKP